MAFLSNGYAYKGENAPGKHCYGCTEREVGCHSKCKKYQEALREWLEYKKQVDTARFQENVFRSHHQKQVRITVQKTKSARHPKR